MEKVIIGIVLLGCFAVSTLSQSQKKPCSEDEANQFDFWVGEWNLEWKTQTGEVQRGTNVVNKVLGGCVVQENFDGGAKLPLKGISHSMFEARSGKWKQTWVDNSGSYLDFVGGMDGDKMILSRGFTGRDGKERMQRMIFFNIEKNSIDWKWEGSTDGGKTWKLAWHIKYSRKN